MKKRLFIILILSALIVSAADKGLNLTNNIAVQLPLGVQMDTRLFFRIPLYKSDHILFKDSRIDIGIQNKASPAYDLAMFRLNIEPIAVFDITFAGGFFCAYNALGYGLIGLSGYDDGFSDTDLEGLPQRNGSGFYYFICPTFKIKFGRVIFMDSVTLNYWDVKNTDFFYERITISVIKGVDRTVEQECYLLYEVSERLKAGLLHYYLYVPGSKYFSHRINTAFIYNNAFRPFEDFYAVLIAGYYLKDPYYKFYLALLAGINFHFTR